MKKCFFFLVVFYFLFNGSLAQQAAPLCNLSSSSSASIPHTGTFRVLVVLCKFSNDNFDLSPYTDLWPSTLNSMPIWGPNLISSTVQQPYLNPSMSGYFKTMSNGLYDVIGDVVFYQPLHEQSYYFLSNGKHTGYLTEEILTAINPVVNYANYDNNGDGTVDMIQICFRFASNLDLDGSNYQGICGLTGSRETFGSGTSLSMDGKSISASLWGSGTFQSGVTDLHGGLPVMVHEFGHYLFGGVHYEGIGYHGLMDGQGSGVMSAFEKTKLGWVTPTLINSSANDVIITDALTTNSVYKIQNTDGSYFLADNHQRVNYYESSWNRYNGGPLVSPGTGLLISHCTSYSIDIESAFGTWTWKKEGSLYVYPFVTDIPSNYTVEDKLKLRNKNTTQGIKNHPDFLGSSDDFFNIGYNQIFSPWSNPSSSPSTSLAIQLLQKDQDKNIHVNFYISNPMGTPPSKPQNLKLTVLYTHPKLTWDANLEPDLAGYNIYRSENGGDAELIGYVPKASRRTYTDNFATTNLPYDNVDYTIKAKDNTDLLSINSDKVSVMATVQKINLGDRKEAPLAYILDQNYPNPFNPSTAISYQIAAKSFVTLKVYDMLGNEVAVLVNEWKEAGSYNTQFTTRSAVGGKQLASGMYFYTLTAGKFTNTKKFILLK